MVSFLGAGSGIDFASITSQLVKVERLPISTLQKRQDGVDHQISLVGDFAMKVRGLKTAGEALDAPGKIRAVKSSSSDQDRVKVSATGDAQLGNFAISVTSLARAQTSQSRTFASDTAGVLGSGTLTITSGTGDPVDIDFDSGDSLSAVARRINDANLGASASVLHDGTNYRLLVSSDETGTDHALTFGDTADAFGFGDSGNTLVTATNAQFTLAGVPVTRSSNTLSDVVAGVTFELVSETPSGQPATTVKIERDPDGMVAKVKSLVDAINNVQNFITGQLGSKTNDPTETLRGDGTLQAFQRRIGSLLSSMHGPDQSSLGTYGIKLASDGSVTLDESKLKTAMSANPNGLTRLLAGTDSNGFISALSTMTEEYTRSGDGILAAKQTTLRKHVTEIDKRIDRIEQNASSLEERLRKQFSAADGTIALLNSQSTYINQMLG